MGLDMYLKATRFVSGYDFNKDPLYVKLLDLFDARELATPDAPGATVEVTVGYWRKANQIHQWFVDNVQDGEDDCHSYYVGQDQLRELRDICLTVLDSLERGNTALAEELLPPQSGFFFGGTDYHEEYTEDLKRTVEQLNRVLEIPEKEWSIEYQASW